MAIFSAIAKAAGKDLTVSSFAKAGYGLRNVVFPGLAGAVSFGPKQPYAIGPAYIEHGAPGLTQMQDSGPSVSS